MVFFFNATPSPSKGDNIFIIVYSEGTIEKRPLPGICLTISSTDKRFVTLQRLPPEIKFFA